MMKHFNFNRYRSTTLKLAAGLLVAQIAAGSRADVIMQGFYWNVPSIAAGNAGADWWWDHLAKQANTLKLDGFGTIWIPPALKGNAGGYSVGYDPFDDYDLGSKNEKGTITTRYGIREQLERCCAIFHANGLNIMQDVVDNHRDGDDGAYNFIYSDAYGNTTGGRFGKGQWDFHPNVPEDPDVWDGGGEVNFGRDLAPVNGASHWVYNGLITSLGWQTNALDLNAYRFDYVKGISADWLKVLMASAPMSGKFAVGEFFDYTLSNCTTWIQAGNYMNSTMSAFDFPARGLIRNMCNSPSTFNMASLDHAGIQGTDPFHAVTFVENHDTDQNDPITQNKLLGYAYILTSEGYPSVFYKDWSTDAGCYGSGLQAGINNLVWIHEKLASGSTTQRYKNNLVFVYERMGGSHLLVGLNNNTGFNYVANNVQTAFGNNVQLHDYTGHCADIWTNGSGQVNLTMPVATNGAGYCCYAPAGLGGSFTAPWNTTTQEYDGAQDLDIKPADNTALVQVSRVWAAQSKAISGALYFDTTGWTSSSHIYLEIDDTNGAIVTSKNYYNTTAQGTTLGATPTATGFYTYKIRSYSTPSGNLKPSYQLKITYTAPQTLANGALP